MAFFSATGFQCRFNGNGKPVPLSTARGNQSAVFKLHSMGLIQPSTQRMLPLVEYRNLSRVHPAKDEDLDKASDTSDRMARPMRVSDYAFCRSDPRKPFGERITWVESGVLHVLELPDVDVTVDNQKIRLRAATGVGIFPSVNVLRLCDRPGEVRVSVHDAFNPETDIRVVDLSAPEIKSAWLPGNYSKGSDGWHGSVCCFTMVDVPQIYLGSSWRQEHLIPVLEVGQSS